MLWVDLWMAWWRAFYSPAMPRKPLGAGSEPEVVEPRPKLRVVK